MLSASPYALRGYTLLKFEPHLHTLHSDGQDDVATMFAACRSAGYDAVALTDHNTVSGLAEAGGVANELRLILIPGIEITTFRGHAVALGVTQVPEWRDLEMRGMDALAADVRGAGGLLSVAHPMALGSPVCSGCAWEWPIEPTSIDLLEVFSSPNPHTEAPLAFWRQLLKRGGGVAPVAAGDVHSAAAAARKRPTTWIFVRERSREGVLEALRQRRVVASIGVVPDFWLEDNNGALALIGERVGHSGWTPRLGASAVVETVEVRNGQRAVYAVRRDAHDRLEAVSAPIWIDTSQ